MGKLWYFAAPWQGKRLHYSSQHPVARRHSRGLSCRSFLQLAAAVQKPCPICQPRQAIVVIRAGSWSVRYASVSHSSNEMAIDIQIVAEEHSERSVAEECQLTPPEELIDSITSTRDSGERGLLLTMFKKDRGTWYYRCKYFQKRGCAVAFIKFFFYNLRTRWILALKYSKETKKLENYSHFTLCRF